MIKADDRLPEATFRVKDAHGNVAKVTTGEYFAGKKVVVVGVPGAFTSTCHKSHIPGLVAGADAMKAKGIDKVAVVSVNDHHVMRAWAESLGGLGKVDFLADGSAEFARATGLVNDATGSGLGIRTHRFAMCVDDGVVKSLDIEPDNGKVTVSSAETILERL